MRNEFTTPTTVAPRRPDKLFMNPLIRKLNRVEEHSDHHATYGGIAAKTCFFLLTAVAGIAIFFLFHNLFETGETMTVEGVTVYMHEIFIVAIAGLLTLVAPMLAFLIKPLVPFLGVIYCLSFGYSITWFGYTYATEYGSLIVMALLITILLVGMLAILYATGAIKVTHRFRAIVTTLFFMMLLSSLAVFLLSFIPSMNTAVSFLRENIIFSVIVSAIYIIIACMFLLVDFDTIKHTVDDRLPKKYEWIAAFALAYTIIYLFLKVLNLLMKLKGSESKSR